MSGLFRTLMFGDLGNWLHIKDVEKQADNNSFSIRLNRALDEEQTRSIIELELVFANLLHKLNEKGILSEAELIQIVDDSEKDASSIMKHKNRNTELK